MNRTLALGIAIFFAVVALALVGSEKSASAGLFRHHGCCGGDCGGAPECNGGGDCAASDCGGCHSKRCFGKHRCHGRKRCHGLFRKHRCHGCNGGGCNGGGCGGAAPAEAPAEPAPPAPEAPAAPAAPAPSA